MLRFAIKRLLMLIPVFLVVSLMIFMIVHLVPGDPIDNLLRVNSTAEQKAALTAQYGLDKPLIVQYGIWLAHLFQGDLGQAIVLRRPVVGTDRAESAAQPDTRLPGPAVLDRGGDRHRCAGCNLPGQLDRSHGHERDTPWFDRARVLAGPVADHAVSRFSSAGFRCRAPAAGRPWYCRSLTIGLGGVALVSRVTRVAMMEIARKDFVLMLHAKGLPSRRIQLRHILRHALLPVVTILSLRIGWILGGAVTIEYVFARPGLGSLLINSLNQRDYPVVQGCLLMLAVAVMLGTLIGDMVQAAMDPRIRESVE